ncbi:MAG TPA: transporter substrate-binding domain-containing protein, partial [Cyclobacteriaceae bacterium]|nr:transporter substrate-binding domain-containing protein [Cyclobacteriaceae bacterium]
QPMGYDYELLKLFAKSLNVNLKIHVISGIGKAIAKLNRGEGDILAFPLTVTKRRAKHLAFTKPHFQSYQVLVQRKPDNWQHLTLDQIEDSLIRDPSELIGKEVYVLRQSAFFDRLENLSEEIGGDIIIKQDSATAATESLMQRVAAGDIDLTVADHAMAAVNAAYYPNLDINTVLSLSQQISWAVRKNSPLLLRAVNEWLTTIKKEPTFMVIYNRYYKSPRTSRLRMQSDYSSFSGNKLSPYDNLIKEGAVTLGWDWRLLAAVIYQESRFHPEDESWAGARGLMQLMPETAERFGANDLNDPRQSLRAGVKYLKYLDRYWSKTIKDPDERIKFVLASYNSGLGHILDAQKLASKYKKDPAKWKDNVGEFLLKKSIPDYYQDPVVKSGYCKCEEPVNYVSSVLDRYEEYKIHISDISVKDPIRKTE